MSHHAAAAVSTVAEWVFTSLAGAVLLLMLIRGLVAERAHRRRIRRYDEARRRHWEGQVVDPASPRRESNRRAFAELDADLRAGPETPHRGEAHD